MAIHFCQPCRNAERLEHVVVVSCYRMRLGTAVTEPSTCAYSEDEESSVFLTQIFIRLLVDKYSSTHDLLHVFYPIHSNEKTIEL